MPSRDLPHSTTATVVLLLSLTVLPGCAGGTWFGLFADREQTTFVTPSRRVEKLQQVADAVGDMNPQQQQQVTSGLVAQIQQEEDPLVREQIVKTLSKVPTQGAAQVLRAGISDDDPHVRIACCRALVARGDPQAVELVSQTLESDSDLDVRLAAVRELGKLKDRRALPALSVALEDNDSAMQRRAMLALESVSDQEFGGNLLAARTFVQSQLPAIDRGTAVASGNQSQQPF